MSESQTNKQIHVTEEEITNLMQCLPKATLRGHTLQMIKYENFWYFITRSAFKSVLIFQKHFVARDSDIFINSLPKTGTTWLKSLLYAIVNRTNYPIIDQSPLVTHHPHELVYNLESDVYRESFVFPRPHHLNELPPPRLFSTHMSYTSLPESIKSSSCRILYICRNPLDMLVSFYYFFLGYLKKNQTKDNEDFVKPSLEDIFEDFCEGKFLYGPYFEHVLEYWNASLERPDKVLFIQYEELKEDPVPHLKKIAQFIGMPFSQQEANEGVIQKIVDFCSIKNMKELDVNKSGVINTFFEKKSYFRKGEVGDWTNHFTPSMVERMKKLMEEKLEGTGLSLRLIP